MWAGGVERKEVYNILNEAGALTLPHNQVERL